MARVVMILAAVGVLAVGGWLAIVFLNKSSAPPVATDAPSGAISKGPGGDKEAIAGVRSQFDPDKELQANELLVINPPANFTDTIRRLNYGLIERFTFQGLGFAVARVRIPSGMTLAAARM